MNNKDNIFSRAIDVFFALLLTFTTLGYTQISTGSTVIRYICGALIIILVLPRLHFENYQWAISLLLIQCFIPIILMIFGLYNYDMEQSIAYIGLFIFYLLLVICLAENYYKRVAHLLFIWQVTLSTVLLALLVFFRGISLNLGYLLNNTISNQRYGSSLLVQRYGMGFKNVNTLALFSMLLIFCSCVSLYHRCRICLSLIDILASIIFILNAESRTPLVLILVLLICYLVIKLKNLQLRLYLKNIVTVCEIIFSIIFATLVISGKTTSFYLTIDNLSSYRLSYGSSAINMLKNAGDELIGIGPLNSSYVMHTVFGDTLTLDNSIEFYLFTIGIIGAILIFTVFFFLCFKVNKTGSNLGFVTCIFYYCYSIFENAIFLPVSAISLLCFTIMIMVIRNDRGSTKH